MKKLNPAQLLVLSFLSVIAAGTFLLSLPFASRNGQSLSLVDSLFTATSATCVTGLVVKNTGTYFTGFGRWVIFFLFQAGGLGIMTFSTLFAVMLGRRIGFHESDAVRSTLDRKNIIGLDRLMLYILGITLLAEAVGAGFLFWRWSAITDWSIVENLRNSVFHSVSAFCNAGFDLFGNSFVSFQGEPYINLVMMALIFFGGIGFVVIMDLLGLFYKKGIDRRLSLQSKVALWVSIVLILAGALFLLFFEYDNVLADADWHTRILGSVFQSVTARTAGFNTLPTAELTTPSHFFLIFLMFVGASPGSTGGGIKTCTFAVIIGLVFGIMKNRKRVKMFDRSIPQKIVKEALVIFFLSLAWVFVFTILVSYFEGVGRGGEATLVRSFFEVVSAYGTVGLSTGITGGLTDLSKLCITLTMFAGRLGPLTLALAVTFRDTREKYTFPEESLMVG